MKRINKNFQSTTTVSVGESIEEKWNDSLKRTTIFTLENCYGTSTEKSHFELIAKQVYAASMLWINNYECYLDFSPVGDTELEIFWRSKQGEYGYGIHVRITPEGIEGKSDKDIDKLKYASDNNWIQIVATKEELKDIAKEFKVPTICFTNLSYGQSIDWGDGNIEKNIGGNISHYYPSSEEPQEYTIKITGADSLDNGMETRTADRMIFVDSGEITKISFGEGIQVSKDPITDSDIFDHYYGDSFRNLKTIEKINNIPANFTYSYELKEISFGNDCHYVGKFSVQQGQNLRFPDDIFNIPKSIKIISPYGFDIAGNLYNTIRNIIINNADLIIGESAFDGWYPMNITFALDKIYTDILKVDSWLRGNEGGSLFNVDWIYVNKDLYTDYKELLSAKDTDLAKHTSACLAINPKEDILLNQDISIKIDHGTRDDNFRPQVTYISNIPYGLTWKDYIEKQKYNVSYSNFDSTSLFSIDENGKVKFNNNFLMDRDRDYNYGGQEILSDEQIKPYKTYGVDR